MKKVIAHLKSTSPYGQSRHYVVPKLEKESSANYEARTWRNRLHTDEDDNVFIPPMAFKNCLAEAAKYLSTKIPGKGTSTYTKHFEAGILVMDQVFLGVKGKQVKPLWLFVPSVGKRGAGKRVDKCFPVLPSREADVVFYILDETITEDVFLTHLQEAGKFIGIGFFRPRNNGYFGRFVVESLKWDV
jgi:hypothetical protein